MILDTHSHLNFRAYKNDLEEVIKRTLQNNIWMINVGTKYETSEEAIKIAEKYEKGVYAAVGLHPIYVGGEFVKIKTRPRGYPDEGEFLIKEQEFNKEKYKELVKNFYTSKYRSGVRKVVAIGEIGLDYYYKPKGPKGCPTKLEQFKEAQKKVFIEQLELAKELNLPVILHCRMAHQNLLEILKSQIPNPKSQINPKSKIKNSKLRGVIHCFTGSWEEARQYMNLGFYIGLNGIIFKLDLDEVIKKCPLDKILVETDCPYLTPPQENGKRNEPIFIKHTIQKITDLKRLSFDEVVDKTTENAKKLFKI